MKRKLTRFSVAVFILTAILCVPGLAYTQAAIKWAKYYGGTGRERDLSLGHLKDGSTIIACGSLSADNNLITNHGSYDIYISRISKVGETIWERSFGGKFGEMFGDIVVDDNDNVYFTSGVESPDGDVIPCSIPGRNFWLVKLDSDGNIIWQRQFGGPYNDQGVWLTIKNNGNVICGGKCEFYNTQTNSKYFKWTVAEYTSEGLKIDSIQLGDTDNSCYCYSVASAKDGGFITATHIQNDSKVIGDLQSRRYDCFIQKFDTLNNLQWESILGGSGDEFNSARPIQLEDGYLFMTEAGSSDFDLLGQSCNDDIGLPGDTWVYKLDFSGKLVWGKCIEPYFNANQMYTYLCRVVPFRKSLFPTEDGGFMTFSITSNPNCPLNVDSTFYPTTLLMTKLDSLGYIEDQQYIGYFFDLSRIDVVNDGQGRWFVAGTCVAMSKTCGDFDYGFGYNGGDRDLWLMELNECKYYTTSQPVGVKQVCSNLTPTNQYLTHPFKQPEKFIWSLLPEIAGTISGNDSIVTISWAANFTGEAKLVVNLSTECGISKPSDTLNIMVYSNCTSIEDLAGDNVKVYFQPNPASKVASLKYSLPEGLNQARVMLVDLEGKVVYTGLVSGSVGTLQVDVSNLKGGVYQCIVEGENARGRCRLVVL